MSSPVKKSTRHRRFYQIWFVVIVQLVGLFVWSETRLDLRQTLMSRELVKPEWHAGKLGEAFSDQIVDDGSCKFFAFSRLFFTPPKTFHSWKRLDTTISLPKSSYFLILFERKNDPDFSDGFRVSRNSEYPSGYILFENNKALTTTWSTISPDTIPEKIDVTLTRHGNRVTMLCNGIELGVFQDDHFAGLDRFCFLAGSTGLVMDILEVDGFSGTTAVTLTENFDQSRSFSDILKSWSGHALVGGGICGVLFLLLYIARLHSALMKVTVWAFLAISWCSWGLQIVMGERYVLIACVLIQFLLFYAIVRFLLPRDLLPDKLTRQGPTSTPLCDTVLWLLTLLTVALMVSVLWFAAEPDPSDSPSQSISRYIPGIKKFFLGDKLVLANRCSDFVWRSNIRMKKDALVEFVFRKSVGERSENLTWYSLTVSSNAQHQSGIYLTQNNYQRLLAPLDCSIEKFTDVNVRIQARGNVIEATIDNLPPVKVRADPVTSGEAALVPINKLFKLMKTEFYSLPNIENNLNTLHDFLIPSLVLLFIQLFMIFRYKGRTNDHQCRQRMSGHFLSLAPLWYCAALSFIHPLSAMTNLFIGSACSFLLHSLILMLLERKRKFFSALEIILLLLLTEIILQVSPLGKAFRENPLQPAIPEELYWYRSASARRWNPLIEHQLFRDKIFTSRRHRLAHRERIRILCLGSSSTAGGYPQYLEEFLNENGVDDVEVIDCGIPGTTTTHLANFYNNLLLRFQPDIVTLCLMRNDMKFLAILAAQHVYDLETSKQGWKYWKTAIYNRLNKIMLYRVYRSSIKTVFQGGLIDRLLVSGSKTDPVTLQRAIDIHIRNMSSLIERARKFKQNPVLLIEPFSLSDGYDTLPEDRKINTIHAYNDLVERYDIPLVDLEQVVFQNRHDLIFIDDVHQNEHGKRLIAEHLALELKKLIEKKGNDDAPVNPEALGDNLLLKVLPNRK